MYGTAFWIKYIHVLVCLMGPMYRHNVATGIVVIDVVCLPNQLVPEQKHSALYISGNRDR